MLEIVHKPAKIALYEAVGLFKVIVNNRKKKEEIQDEFHVQLEVARRETLREKLQETQPSVLITPGRAR